jgi:hypothetical protein
MPEEPTPNQPSETDAPAPEATSAEDTKAKTPQEKPARAAKATAESGDAEKPAKAKKEKPPAVEDKPFTEFISQDYIPALKQTLSKVGIQDLDLKFEKQKLPISGTGNPDCWQVVGHWRHDGQKTFIIIFSKEDIQAPKFFCYADNGAVPSTLESFMIDERKVSLDLLLLYTVQRLNGQKWLVRN